MRENLVRDESYDFALKIMHLCKTLDNRRIIPLQRQLLKSGTSIGANVEEALAAQSRADFISKMSIASKEARETNYWLRLFRDSGQVAEDVIQPLLSKSTDLVNILTSIVKTSRQTQGTDCRAAKIRS